MMVVSAPDRREDILVSIAFPDLSPSDRSFGELRELARQVDAAFRFWEMVLVVYADEAAHYEGLIRDVANLRLFKVRRGGDFYRRRAVAAAEAIGDVVVLAADMELSSLDLIDMVRLARDRGEAVMGRRNHLRFMERLLASPLAALGRGAGFKVDIRDMQTIAFPRTLLNQVLAHPDRELALRFPPRDSGIPLSFVIGRDGRVGSRPKRNLRRRLWLMQKLLNHLAPLLLRYVTLLSGLTTLMAIGYAVYAILVWAVADSVQPGWFTLSLMLSATATFLGMAIFAIGLGLQNLLGRVAPSLFDDVVGEVNMVDLFHQVSRDLNVHIDMGHDATQPEQPADDALHPGS